MKASSRYAMRVRAAFVLMCLVVAALPISAYAVPVPTITASSATVNVGDTFHILTSISSPTRGESSAR